MKKRKKVISLVLVLILATGMGTLAGCKKEITNAEQLVVTVENSKIYLDEMMYYILQVEAKGESMNQVYQNKFGTSYWDEEYQEGITFREMFKNDTIDMAVMYDIFYDKAMEAGYTLSKEDKEINKSNTKTLLESMTEEQKTITELTEEKILKLQEKLALGGMYYDNLMDDFSIDEESIKKAIDYDEYRQYDIEYIFIPTATTKKDGSLSYYSKAKKKKAYANIDKILSIAKAGISFSEIVTEDSKDFQTSELSFVEGDETCEEGLEKPAIALKTGEVSDIIGTDFGYYIIKMINDNSSESYDAAVEDAITSAKIEAFDAEYEKIEAEYTVTVNDKVWDTIVMGETTIPKKKETESSTEKSVTE